MADEYATENLNMRIPPSLKLSVIELAEVERREVSAMARVLIEEALATRAKKAAKKQ